MKSDIFGRCIYLSISRTITLSIVFIGRNENNLTKDSLVNSLEEVKSLDFPWNTPP